MPQFRILDLPGREPFDLKLANEGVIGRDESADFKLDHPTVSRKHAKIHKSGQSIVLVDLGSANGTRVNGKQISAPTTLAEGDEVQIGKISALFFHHGSPTALASVAPSDKSRESGKSEKSAESTQPAKRSNSGSVSPLKATHQADSSATLPLDRFEDVLSGLVEILAEPRSLPLRAQHIGQIFHKLLPSLKQAALLDPCGKLIGGIRGGRMMDGKFYDAIAGALGAHNGTLQLEGPVLAGLFSQLNIAGVMPSNIVCLPLECAVLPGCALYLEADGPFFSGEFADTIRLGARLLGPLLDRAPEDYRFSVGPDDFRLAERIQKRMMSEFKPIEGLSIGVQYVPHYCVGGDFLLMENLGKREFAFVLGDVSGKGVSGALVAAQVMAAARALLLTCKGPADFLGQLNASLSSSMEPGVFATVAAVFMQADKGACRLALAGHNPPVIRTKSGKVLEFGFDPGAPLGALSKLEVKEQRIMLAAGDALVVNSDGLDEAEKPVKNKNFVSKLSTGTTELFGSDRRNEVISRTPGAQNIAIALREAVFSFSDAERSSDDLTILVIERA